MVGGSLHEVRRIRKAEACFVVKMGAGRMQTFCAGAIYVMCITAYWNSKCNMPHVYVLPWFSLWSGGWA